MNNTGPTSSSSGKLRYVIFLGVTASLGGLMFGFDLGIITGAGPFLIQHFGLSDLGLGWAYSSLLFGCVLGSLVAGRLTDRYGRQKMLVLVALLFVLTSLATGLAPSFAWLIVARFAGGLAVGGVSVLSPLYIAEVAPPAIRGRMGTTYQLSVTAGILISYLINYGLRNVGDWNWRWMFMTGALPSVVFFLALLRAPETPRFLFKSGKTREAQDLLAQLMSPQEAELETAEVTASLQSSAGAQGGYDMRRLRRPLIISFFLGMLIQVSGINTIIDYAPLVFRSAGWKIDAALFSTFLIGAVNFLCTLIAFWTIDRYGRKPLYMTGSVGMALSLLALIGMLAAGRLNSGLLLLPIVCFTAFFAACIGPVFWTLAPEIFPNKVRGRCMIVPVITQWVTNALVILFFPLAFNRLGKIPTFGFLACMCVAQAVFTWFFLPETKGKTLEEIEAHWGLV